MLGPGTSAGVVREEQPTFPDGEMIPASERRLWPTSPTPQALTISELVSADLAFSSYTLLESRVKRWTKADYLVATKDGPATRDSVKRTA